MMSSGAKNRADYVDIHRVAASMRKEIDSYWLHYEAANSAANLFSLHKVPQHILGVDRTAYEPTILSIGPYHHGKEPLQAMEKEKWNCLNFILRSNCSKSLQDYLKVVARYERRARSCYSEKTQMDRKKFLQMLLLDGCFLLVFLNGVEGNADEFRGADEGCSSSQEIQSETIVNRAGLSLENKEGSNLERVSREDYQSSSSNLELCEVRRSSDRKEKTLKQNNQELNDSAGMGGWYSCCLAHDFLLFENQIPFYIMEGIYRLFAGTDVDLSFLMERIAKCMESILRHYPIAIQESNRPKNFHHLLHLCHMYFRPSQKFEEKHQNQVRERYFYRLLHFFEKNCPLHFGKKYSNLGDKQEETQQMSLQTQQLDCLESEHLPSRWRRAIQYHEAGVSLKKREYDKYNRHSLLDVKFINGAIEIPCIPIDENTEALFKNLIALEQTNPRYGNDLTAYISFMSQLVTTPDDAALLVKQGIIVHMMDSDEELSSLFTRLVKQVVINAETNYYLKSLCQTLEIHYQSRLNRWIAWLLLNHFSNPWLALAVLATIVVLICTVVQTIFTVLAYVKPPEQLV
ncbi:hypothetical protein EJB05_39893, partial [Eragrostis curvula]